MNNAGLREITEEEFNMSEDMCCSSPLEQDILQDDTEDLYEALRECLDITDEWEVKRVIGEYKQIPVYKKRTFSLPSGFLLEAVESYAEDRWFMESSYDIQAVDILDEAERKFNECQIYFLSGQLLGYMDLSEKAEKVIGEINDEENKLG